MPILIIAWDWFRHRVEALTQNAAGKLMRYGVGLRLCEGLVPFHESPTFGLRLMTLCQEDESAKRMWIRSHGKSSVRTRRTAGFGSWSVVGGDVGALS